MLGRGAGGLAGNAPRGSSLSITQMRLPLWPPPAGKAPISAETRPHAVLVNRLGGCQGRPTNQHAVPQELVAAELLSLFC
jgi:hypothetical protein